MKCLILVLATTTFCGGADNPQVPAVKVSLAVSSESKQSAMVSYLSRHFRAIPGVDVTDRDTVFKVVVVAVEVEDYGIIAAGVTVMRYAHTNFGKSQLVELLNAALSRGDSQAPVLDELLGNSVYEEALVFTSSTGRIEELCKRIVASIDGGVFEEYRKEKRASR